MGVLRPVEWGYYISVEIRYREYSLQQGCSIGVATMREVFYSAISQGVALFL